MDVWVDPGTYVVAVSGGVDSMAILNMLRVLPGVHLIVAHYDHGIREDSGEDRKFVQETAEQYGLPFVYAEGRLGSGTSEAAARVARYEFLEKARDMYGARAIITAHHQDDVLETAIINVARGTHPRGLASLDNHLRIVRPALNISKKELMQYALDNNLGWREDSTNASNEYLRNHIRHNVLPRLDMTQKYRLKGMIEKAREQRRAIDETITTMLHLQSKGGKLDRDWFNELDHSVAKEVMAGWLRAHNINNFDRRLIDRLVVSAKVLPAGKRASINSRYVLKTTDDYLSIEKNMNLGKLGETRYNRRNGKRAKT